MDYKGQLDSNRLDFKMSSNYLEEKSIQLIELEKKLHYVTYYDSLTKLFNKEKIHLSFKNLVKDDFFCSDIAFFFIDIDNFGYINSVLGYQEGNSIIKKFSEILKSRYDKHYIARLSADEFLILYLFDNNEINLEEELSDFVRGIRDMSFSDRCDINLTISIGVSIYKKHGSDFYDLIKNADTALFCAKANGKDRYEIYKNQMEINVFDNVDLINQIKVGLKKDEFEMYYQPIISTDTETLAGLEALIRWNHNINGFIPPDRFIPIAEEYGMMLQIERWVIESVFYQVEKWVDMGDIPIFVSINLSSKGLLENNLVEFLTQMLDKYRVEPEKIQFEVTETSMISNLEASVHILDDLRKIGFKLALDDFGVGYSSLNYLKNLPINKVKLDKSLIDNIVKDNKERLLTKALIEMSHYIDLEVVAEGIEMQEQVELLSALNCDYIQGYYYGRPSPKEQINKWIKDYYLEKNQ